MEFNIPGLTIMTKKQQGNYIGDFKFVHLAQLFHQKYS